MCLKKQFKMVKDHLILQDHSGKLLWHGSPASEYLENLPLANAEENCRETDTRYLLPRNNIFTFGLQNGITDRVIFFSCKMCQSFIKPHEVKQHMLTKHPRQENSSTSSNQSSISTQQSSGKSKKSSHKSKKKIVPPPSVPPPPLFPKIDFPPPSTVSVAPSTEDLLPPVLQPAEAVEENTPASRTSSEKVEDVSTSVSNLPPTLPTQVPTQQLTVTTSPSVSKSKEKPTKVEKPAKVEKPTKVEKQSSSKHKRSKRRRTSNEYDPDKHCGVVDSSKKPCMRAVTCANHTILERRAVKGRRVNVDKLITAYKASRIKSKPQHPVPISIAPKQCASLKEVRNGFQVIELIYENDNQNLLRSTNLKCPDDPILTSALEDLASMTHRAVATLPKEDTCLLKSSKLCGSGDSANNSHSPESEQVSGGSKLPTSSLLKVSLSQPSPPLPVTKLAEVPSSMTPSVYSLHPKPMTMPTGPLRRVGSSFVLQQAPRLDRQRVDLQAVVNQHKQLKTTTPNKTVSLLNSNHNKQSILKSNIKNNAKINPLKRSSIEKSGINDVKHMKVIATDMNGFILNADFSENSDIQPSNTVQDKITLLK